MTHYCYVCKKAFTGIKTINKHFNSKTHKEKESKLYNKNHPFTDLRKYTQGFYTDYSY